MARFAGGAAYVAATAVVRSGDGARRAGDPPGADAPASRYELRVRRHWPDDAEYAVWQMPGASHAAG